MKKQKIKTKNYDKYNFENKKKEKAVARMEAMVKDEPGAADLLEPFVTISKQSLVVQSNTQKRKHFLFLWMERKILLTV